MVTVASVANEAKTPAEGLQHVINETCKFTNWKVGHTYIRRTIRSSNEKSTERGTQKDEEEAGTEEVIRPTGIWNRALGDSFETFRRVTNETTVSPGEGLLGQIWSTASPNGSKIFPKIRASCGHNWPQILR